MADVHVASARLDVAWRHRLLSPASNTLAPFWHNPPVRAEDRPDAPRTLYRRPSMRRPLLRAQVNKRGNPWQEPLYVLFLPGSYVYLVAAVLLEAQATVDPEAHRRRLQQADTVA